MNDKANLPALSKQVSELVLAGSLHHAEQAFSEAVEQHGDLVVSEVLGTLPPTEGRTIISQVCTLLYFSFFLFMPWWSTMGTFKKVPDRVVFHPH